jgi:uncharacterized protein CbrC (UPF0167 family)
MTECCEFSGTVNAEEIIDLLSSYQHLKKELLCVVNYKFPTERKKENIKMDLDEIECKGAAQDRVSAPAFVIPRFGSGISHS